MRTPGRRNHRLPGRRLGRVGAKGDRTVITRSAFLKAPGQVELRRVELNEPVADGKALIRIEACGICGTDLSAFRAKAREWTPFGHEIAGVIEEIGAGAPHLSPGMRVVLESSSYCGHCELCRNGRVDLCCKAPNMWAERCLGMSDRMTAPVACIVPYHGLSPDIASLAEPAGVALDMVKTADIKIGDRVCLLGPGPIGLMAIAIARHAGATSVACVGRPGSDRRLATARELGAQTYVTDGPLGDVTGLARSFDHVLLTTPVSTIPDALSLLDYGGRLTYIGIGDSEDGRIAFDGNDFHFRKLQLRASYAAPAIYYPTVLRLLEAGVIPGERIISHRFELDAIAKAIDVCLTDRSAVVKVVVTPEGRSS